MMNKQNANLAEYTSLGVGGPAENLIEVSDLSNIIGTLKGLPEPKWFLGYGANVLISDEGLPGTTLIIRGGEIKQVDDLLIADAGTEWDELVKLAISKKLWGLELMSGIPGGIGAAVVGNIAAYGQAVKDSLVWVEALNTKTGEVQQFLPNDLEFNYRYSVFQKPDMTHYLILKAAFRLANTQTKTLEYVAALHTAESLDKDINNLNDLRDVIIETRRRGGSLLDTSKTAGSFFRNPLVDMRIAEEVIKFDETGKSKAMLEAQHKAHGGDAARVSAALILLAAGFKRGQSWGPVRLHPEHVLKVENTGGATASQIYDVAQEIMRTVEKKLSIKLDPEVRFLGKFN